jgi:hypothetical protein
MKQDEFFKLVGILIVCFFIIYMVLKMFQIQSSVVEGLTSNDGSVEAPASAPSSGEAGSASSYAAAIKAQVVKMQDELLISKYRKDYETALINLDDYIGYLMLKQSLNMKMGEDKKAGMESIAGLNALKSARESLEATMTFLDKQ